MEDKNYLVAWVLVPLVIGLVFMILFGVFDRKEEPKNPFYNSAEW